jgi:hypothetical protein
VAPQVTTRERANERVIYRRRDANASGLRLFGPFKTASDNNMKLKAVAEGSATHVALAMRGQRVVAGLISRIMVLVQQWSSIVIDCWL